MTKYEVILYWSNEENAFIAEVPELSGCVADGANSRRDRVALWPELQSRATGCTREIALEVLHVSPPAR